MKASWRRVQLGDVADVSYGFTAKASFEEIGPKFLRITDIQSYGVDWDTVPNCEIPIDKYEQHRLSDGDIVFARTGATTGKSYLLRETPDAVAASYLIRLRVTDRKLLPQYVAYFFQTKEYWAAVNAGTTGSAQGGFNASKLCGLTMPCPNRLEQKRIVTILDEAFERIDTSIANTEKNLANARELFESYLNKVFSEKGPDWVSLEIGNCIKFIDYRGKTPEKTQEGLRLITAKNIKKGYVQEIPMEYVAPETYSTWMTRGIPKYGDILFTTEAPLANVAQLDTEEKVVFAQRIIIMQPDETLLDGSFLKFLLLSQPTQKVIHDNGTGATVKGIKAKLLKTINIFFPRSIEEQKKIVMSLETLQLETQKLESLLQEKLTSLIELKQSLLQKAFSGELTTDFNPDALEH